MAGLEFVDESRMASVGFSQGGALAIACAALSGQMGRTVAGYPFLADFCRVRELDYPNPAYDELKLYFRLRDPRHEKENGFFERLGYLDTQWMAEKLTAPVLFYTGLADMMMFSINPSYDYQHGEYANGSATERMALYRRCEAEGVGISVMKAFAGGQLLDARTSPFGQALTEYQCIQYALDKPGVLTVLPGVRDRADLERVLGFLRAGEAERDYSVISSLTPRDAEGTCVYCNHCQPCPAGLDVGLINKYYDLARAGDALAAEHYRNLSLGADACISCGHCDRRCPFHVSQSARMREIASYFRQA